MDNGKDRGDWKENLSAEAEQSLNLLLEATRKHRCAYKSAENIQIAQVWCALVEQMRMVDKLEQRVAYIERILDSMFKGHTNEREALLKGLTRF
ncbi:MAG: hypothetical protein JW727_05810 [Candidatus Aenigmarchaeota archaeon]|nr:hypothetical protein [Candidatus Aenigmarchaeota archaeon]